MNNVEEISLDFSSITSWVPSGGGDGNRPFCIGTYYPYGHTYSPIGRGPHMAGGIYDDFRIYDHALSATERNNLYEMGQYLIAHYPLDANANDYSGEESHGTDTAVTYVSGIIDNAGSFNGTTSKIELPSTLRASVNPSAGSVSAWFNSDDAPTGSEYVISMYQEAGGTSDRIYCSLSSSSEIRVILGGTIIPGFGPPPPNQNPKGPVSPVTFTLIVCSVPTRAVSQSWLNS